MLVWKTVIFLLLWSFSYACDRNTECVIDESDPVTAGLLTSMSHLETQLIQKLLYSTELDANLVISPMTIHAVLVLLIFGSAGDTQKEIITALKFPSGDMQVLRKTYGDIIIMTDRKRSKNVDGKEYIAVEGFIEPGIFIQKDFPVIPTYSDYLAALNIPINTVDFANNLTDALAVISKWIEDSKPKGGSGVSVAVSIQPNTRLYINSLFYLTAKWKENLFLDIAPVVAPFTLLNNQQVDVEMMKTQYSLLYYDKKDKYTAIEIPFEGDDYAALYILPYPGLDAVTFLTTFTMAIVEEFVKEAVETNVNCQVPIISYSFSTILNENLQACGINKLFGVADLKNMFDLAAQNFGVQLAHSGDLTLNTLGVNANEILAVNPVQKPQMTGELTPFIANRPFVLLIRSLHSYGIVLATFFHKV